MILMDGAMGTVLMSRGLRPDSCLESLNLTRPDLIRGVHRAYAKAGAKVLLTNTFGANRIRLGRWATKLEAINRAGVRLAKSAKPKAKVFASIGPLGPRGKSLGFERKRRIFREQAAALAKEKPDGFLIETMTSLSEAEAATVAVREVFHGTIITSMAPVKSFQPLRVSKTLRRAGADVLGINCGREPKDAFALFKALAKRDKGPLCARPAGGEDFAAWALKFQKWGCEWFGGCCGTTPAIVKATAKLL